MKIRIKGNSVRYRLTKTEVSTLAETGAIVEETCFGTGAGQKLKYALEMREDIQHLQADFNNQRITMYLPAEAAKKWPQEERTGFEYIQNISPGIDLHLLLEKDFVCLDETIEDQSDNYPNPHYERKD